MSVNYMKVLIANRGEIACRIISTCKKLKYDTVAIYTSDDKNLHTEMADQAFQISNYLAQEEIIELAIKQKIDAIHPGYGFLSENPTFANLCEGNDIRFVGPTAKQMEMFAIKHIARKIAEENGVSVLPGSDKLTNLEEAVTVSTKIGYPIILKSSAGGVEWV